MSAIVNVSIQLNQKTLRKVGCGEVIVLSYSVPLSKTNKDVLITFLLQLVICRIEQLSNKMAIIFFLLKSVTKCDTILKFGPLDFFKK